MTNSETAIITYKALSGLGPGYLSNIFKKNSALNTSMNLRNATADVLVTRMKTCSRQKCYPSAVQRLGMSCPGMSSKHPP